MATGTQTNVTSYIDLNYYGVNTDSGLMVVKSFAAIKQVIKLYLLSRPGDYGRNVLKGGPLFALIGKRMLSASEIEEAVSKAMEIFTNIEVANLVAKKDLQNRMWIVSMQIIDTANKAIDNLSIGIPAAS